MAIRVGSSNYGVTDEESLGRAGFSSKEFNTRSGKLEDAVDSLPAAGAFAVKTDSDDYSDGSYETDSNEEENY